MSKQSSASENRPSALFLSPESPFPMVGGGALRSASVFEYLRRQYDTDVITFRQPGQADPREAFPKNGARRISVIDLPPHSKAPLARLFRNLNRAALGRPPLIDRFSGFASEIARHLADDRYDVAVIEHFWGAQYEAQLRPHCDRLYLDLHNLESAWHRTLADAEHGPARLAYNRFARACEQQERTLLPRFDALLTASRDDSEKVRRIAPDARPVVYPNALPEIALPQAAKNEAIVFSGNLEYQPNVSAVRFFRDRIWPSIRSRCPGMTWVILGKNPSAVAHLVSGDDRVQITGPVENAIAEIAKAKIAVVPLLAGSGTRIKILEAWAAGTPVVSTALGAEGLEATSGEHLIIADDPREFADAVVRLAHIDAERTRIASAGRQLYERKYTWPRAWEALDLITSG